MLRVVGGQAAAMHAGTVVLAHAVPHPAPREDTQERYELALRVLERALEALGVATERGELPGEWCPGRHSLHAGPRKLAGVAQRVRMRAALTEALVIAADPAPLRSVLADVHEALGVGFAPETVGAVAELAAADTDAVEAALVAALAQERALEPAEPDPALLAAAAELRPRHDLGA